MEATREEKERLYIPLIPGAWNAFDLLTREEAEELKRYVLFVVLASVCRIQDVAHDTACSREPRPRPRSQPKTGESASIHRCCSAELSARARSAVPSPRPKEMPWFSVARTEMPESAVFSFLGRAPAATEPSSL